MRIPVGRMPEHLQPKHTCSRCKAPIVAMHSAKNGAVAQWECENDHITNETTKEQQALEYLQQFMADHPDTLIGFAREADNRYLVSENETDCEGTGATLAEAILDLRLTYNGM